jgi:hypothetical protein
VDKLARIEKLELILRIKFDAILSRIQVNLIALHKVIQNLGAGGTIFLVQVDLLIVSNTSLQRMVGTHERVTYFTGHR